MRTLLDQWNELEAIIEQRCQAIIDEYLKQNECPKVFYDLDGYRGIDECKVIKICINEYKVNGSKPYFRKKPTRVNVSELTKYVEDFKPNKTHLALEYEQVHSYGKSTSQELIADIIPEKEKSFNPDDLLPLLAKKKELYEPKDGYIRCEYCGKQRLPADIMQDIIISPNWKHQGCRSPLRNYCKDSPCHAYDQMGHEG